MGNTYQKTSGSAGSKGVDFQIDLLSVFLLNALQSIKNWKLSTENKLAGKFDDVVLELSDGSAILLQAKHKENKKITLDQFLSTNSRNDDFSLPKYFFSYLDIKSRFPVKSVIICTNTQADLKAMGFLNQNNFCRDSILHYENAASCFTFSDDILPKLTTNARIYQKNNIREVDADDSVINEENLKDFLKHLQIYLDYPSGSDLKGILEQLLSSLKCHGNMLRNTSYRDLHQKVKDWFEQPKGEYLTELRTRAMFCEIKSDKYRLLLENYKVYFRSNDLKFTSSKRIFHVIAEDGCLGCLLYLMKVYRSLQHTKTKVLYAGPEDGLDVQEQVIEAFELPMYTYLVIISPKFRSDSIISYLSSKLKDILHNQNYKKVIFVAERYNNLAHRMISTRNDYEIFDKPLTLEDLSEETQKMIKKKNILFQGEEVTLEELFPKKMHMNEKCVKPKILENLIRNKNIAIGVNTTNLDDVSMYYINRKFMKRVEEVVYENESNTNTKEIVFEEDIYNVKEKTVLISDGAGAGKTTVLKNLAVTIKKNNPQLWVIRIELNDCTKILRDSLKNGKSIDIHELLSCKDTTKLKNELEVFIFSLKRMVVLMFDGVDEISPDYTCLILDLLVQSQNAENVAKVFVTTRPHMAPELETRLNITSFTLMPFTEENQIVFLTNYWAHNLELKSEDVKRCERYAEALINRLSSWMMSSWYADENNRFIALPLQARMLAEVFLENRGFEEWEGCKEFLRVNKAEPKLPEKMNITKLYDMFIEKKKDIFMEKGNPTGNAAANQALMDQFQECLTYHRVLALEVILDTRKCVLFSCYQPGIIYQVMTHKEIIMLKMGIVQKLDNKLCFIHRTFAEHFVAESLLMELQQNNNEVFLGFIINEIFFSSEFSTLRNFFNNCLQNHILPSSPDIFKKYMSSNDGTRNFNLIHRLAREGHTEIIRFILKCIDFKIIRGKEVLGTEWIYFSGKRNTFNILKYLVKLGGINIKDDKDRTPLHRAVLSGHLDTVKFLVDMGADVNNSNELGETPLHLAAEDGTWDIVKFLLESGVDTNVRNEEGQTALHIATKGGRRHVVELLIEHEMAINTADEQGRTALHLAARGDRLDLVQFFVEHNTDINIADQNGRTALHLAAQKGSKDIVEFLMKLGIDVNVTDKRGRTALHLAAKECRLDAVQALVKYNVDVNATDKKGRTALHLAIKGGCHDIVQLLKECGANINIIDCIDNQSCTASRCKLDVSSGRKTRRARIFNLVFTKKFI